MTCTCEPSKNSGVGKGREGYWQPRLRRLKHPFSGSSTGKLVAAGSRAARAFWRNLVEGSSASSQQDLVAGEVPVEVVDPLEMIEVEHEEHAAWHFDLEGFRRARASTRGGWQSPVVGFGVGVPNGRAARPPHKAYERHPSISLERRQPNRMIAMLSRNATLSVLAELGRAHALKRQQEEPGCRGVTNSSSAAIVAHVVITWLPAMRTALLLVPYSTLRIHFLPRVAYDGEEVNFLLR